MLRLVTRLCQILERPEGDLNPQWAETGALGPLGFEVSNPMRATSAPSPAPAGLGKGRWFFARS